MPEASESNPKRLVIRKYPNRRYYDTTRSRHVTLEEIYALIRDGYEVQITDSKSEQDITAKVLGQIIIELDPPKMGAFPVPLLHRLLRSNEALVSDFIQKYNQALAAFLDSQRSVEQYLRSAMGMSTPSPTVADWTKLMWGPFNPALWGMAPPRTQNPDSPQPASASAPPPPPPAPSTPSAAPSAGPASPPPAPNLAPPPGSEPAPAEKDVRQLVDELRQQLADLQEQLGGTKKKRGRSGR